MRLAEEGRGASKLATTTQRGQAAGSDTPVWLFGYAASLKRIELAHLKVEHSAKACHAYMQIRSLQE